MFRHNTKQVSVSSQYHADVSSPNRHRAQPPRTDKFYAQRPVTTGHIYPRHSSAITLGSAEFCWYRNTFGSRAF